MTEQISLAEATARAQAGDARAQYALSALLHRQGRFEESVHWLALAAAQRLGAAQLTLATLLVDGRHCPRDLPRAVALLEPLAATHVQANLLLAELHGFAALGAVDRGLALRYLQAAARMGEAGALRQLALLAACQKRVDLVQPLLAAAARGGDDIAGQLLLRHGPAAATAAPQDVDWLALDQAMPGLAAGMALPAAETLHEFPLVRRMRAAVPPIVLDAVIARAGPLVRRSQIVDASTGESRADPMRSSSHVTLGPREHDHVLEALERCIGQASGLPTLNGEFLQVLRYRRGEEFRPHVDYFNEGGAGSYRSLADGGQRAQTVLVYLNEGYSGGSTRFPKLGLDVHGSAGDLLDFHNLGADGLGHRDTLHAGMPVESGEKWLLSQWIRADRYPPRMAW